VRACRGDELIRSGRISRLAMAPQARSVCPPGPLPAPPAYRAALDAEDQSCCVRS